MSAGFDRMWTLIRGRWRWMRGRCPACNRELRASSSKMGKRVATCAICMDETQMDLRVWHNFRRSLAGAEIVETTKVGGGTALP
jgi:hypothetical protein